jgi:hypothetical protein
MEGSGKVEEAKSKLSFLEEKLILLKKAQAQKGKDVGAQLKDRDFDVELEAAQKKLKESIQESDRKLSEFQSLHSAYNFSSVRESKLSKTFEFVISVDVLGRRIVGISFFTTKFSANFQCQLSVRERSKTT